ncbi:hypothetical protein VTL71DRAFT_450 [Oculimacula yallundae]|uniref:BZIP domain-containing protein n=1 Tax=Oculimacula yallundae TaxID=86028 RepID=A0ABR4D037_9HELO
MDYQPDFDYAGNPFLNTNPYAKNALPTPNMFESALYDFSDMLNNTPSGDDVILPMPDTFQPNVNLMGGNYNHGSEYPFPAIPTSMPAFSFDPANAMAPGPLSGPNSDFVVDTKAQPDPGYLQEPQLASLQAQQELISQQSAPSKAQVEKALHVNPDTTDEPKPKRRRGARKKKRTPEEEAIKRALHLERNRSAAQKCRQKKKLGEAELKDSLMKERQENEIVWIRVTAVEAELEGLRNLALELENSCECEEQKHIARAGLEAIMQTASKLQAQIDYCNQARSEVSAGLVMQRSPEGYVTRDNLPELERPGSSGSASRQGSQPMSPRAGSSQPMSSQASNPSTTQQLPVPIQSPLASNMPDQSMRINTDMSDVHHSSREGSNGSSNGHRDSAVDCDSPPGAKKDSASPSQEDEGIDDSVYLAYGTAKGPVNEVARNMFPEDIFVAA